MEKPYTSKLQNYSISNPKVKSVMTHMTVFNGSVYYEFVSSERATKHSPFTYRKP